MILSASESARPHCKDSQVALLSMNQNRKALAKSTGSDKSRPRITYGSLFYAVHIIGNMQQRQHLRPRVLKTKTTKQNSIGYLKYALQMHP